MPKDANEVGGFRGARAKLTIASLDEVRELFVEAQYNPKELQVTQAMTWKPHEAVGGHELAALRLEFGGMQPQTLQVELLFDGYEHDGLTHRVDADHPNPPRVSEQIARLKQLAAVRDPLSKLSSMRRPHICVVSWGKPSPRDSMAPLTCVIESLATKYLAFSTHGVVLRASCTVSLKEIDWNNLQRHERAPNRVGPRRP